MYSHAEMEAGGTEAVWLLGVTSAAASPAAMQGGHNARRLMQPHIDADLQPPTQRKQSAQHVMVASYTKRAL